MDKLKPKSIKGIEQKMEGLDKDSLRYHILESAKSFKTSWVELGRALYGVCKDKVYKGWGYNTLEAYTSRELGIRKQTAMKLLRSYYFLEKEEPRYLREDYVDSTEAALVPGYESVDILRLAKNKKTLDNEDYAHLKKEVFEEGRDYHQVRKDLTALIRQRDELQHPEAWKKRKLATVKRFLANLKALRREIEIAKLLPSSIIRETQELIERIESQVS